MLLVASMVVNLGLLAFFKYFNFFAQGLEKILIFFGLQPTFPIMHIILPVGISFYTFQSMSYTIDVYRGEMRATRNLSDYLLFVAFFPQLVAGPIIRAKAMLPQIVKPRIISNKGILDGLWLIILGYVKKMVIADRMAGLVNWGFMADPNSFSLMVDSRAWLVLYAFAFQIYGDFSGYTDIARGLGKVMGFDLAMNFKAPYLITNPSAFWRNWHISLSTWFRDYLYVVLGGNRLGSLRTYLNLMSTMILGGLWHGAGAAYIMWGIYHGLLLCLHRFWMTLRHTKSNEPIISDISRINTPAADAMLRMKYICKCFIFFHVICIGWLLFRAGSLPAHVDFHTFIKSFVIVLFNFPDVKGFFSILQPVMLLGCLSLFLQSKNEEMNHFSTWSFQMQICAFVSALVLIAAFGIFEGAQFIYFQF
ncbi:MAG: MBOAT family protein [Proteobacteria bacterium]|nr:MBOAT family protein [Pseudomonadota bacterium]